MVRCGHANVNKILEKILSCTSENDLELHIFHSGLVFKKLVFDITIVKTIY